MNAEKASPDPSGPDEASQKDVLNDRYRIVKSLGRGGMGEVFYVEDMLRENQPMALKTLLPQTTDRLLTSGFKDEFAELAKIRHPNLAAAYDFGRVVGTDEHFFTTEFIDGVDLMEGTREASLRQLIQVMAQLLRGLDFIHNHKLLHNDLKPANILLETTSGETTEKTTGADLDKLESLVHGDCGRVKIIDFGLICREGAVTEKILGTLRYISPERIQKAAPDRRSDLYSIGVVLYTLFARRVPFDDNDVRKLLRMHLEQPPPQLAKQRHDLPDVVPTVIHRLLEKKPEDRFATASEALEFLGRALGWHETPTAGRWGGKRISAGALLFRDEEFQTLKEKYDQARSGKAESHCILVKGSAGVGKSRLVEELRSHVQVTGGVFIEASGPAIEGNLRPLLEAVMAGLKTSGVEGLDKFHTLLEEDRRSNPNNLASFIEKLVLLYTNEVPLLIHLDDFDRASDTVNRFALELIHTADYRARKNGKPYQLLVILSRRVSHGRPLSTATGSGTLTLSNFDENVARQFLCRVFAQNDIPDAVLDQLVQTSGGNPLFLIELANTLIERKQVTYSGSRWSFPQTLEGLALPESLGNLFEEKLAGLRSESLEVLYWLAVGSNRMPRGVLVRCLRFDEAKLGSVLSELVQKNLVSVSTNDADNEEEYVLSHAGSRETLCERLSDDRIRQLHLRIAQNIEEEYPNWEERADELAGHWLLSGNDAGFLRFAPKAADLLRERGDFEKAVDYRQRLADAMPDTALGKKIQSLSKLSEMHEMLWDLSACMMDLSQIERLGQKLMKPADKALLLRRMACVEMARHRNKVADSFLSGALTLLGDSPPPPSRLAVEAPRVWTLWFTGEHAEATACLDRCLTALPADDPQDPQERMMLVGAINHIAKFLHSRGSLDEAAALYERNLRMLDGIDQKQGECATHCALGDVLLELGRFCDAETHLETCLDMAKEIGDCRSLSKARERYGEYHLRFGRFRRALQVTQAALQDAESLDNSTAIANSLRTLGRIFVSANELEDARKVFERAVDLQGASKDIASGIQCRIELARLLIDSEVDQAKRILAECDHEARKHELPLLMSRCSLWLFVTQWKTSRHYNLKLLEQARAGLGPQRFILDYLELLLVQLEAATDLSNAKDVQMLTEEIERLTSGPDTPDLGDEIEYCRALGCLRNGEVRRAAVGLKTLYKKCRNESNIRLAVRCRTLLEQIAATENAVPA